MDDQTKKDTAYSPGSETETEEKQDEPRDSTTLDKHDVDSDAVKTLPGTGGPDDVGDIEVDEADIHLPSDPTGTH
jgi:hypothetical protein